MDKIKVNSDKKNASIEELEYAIVSKNYVDADSALISLITMYVENKVELTAGPYDRELSSEQKNLESYQVIEKLATLLTVWFSDWSYTPSSDTYSFVCLQKTFINNLFSASSYHSTDHILSNLGLVNNNDYTPEQLRRLLFVITIESAIDVPWALLFQYLPEVTVLAYTGQLRSINIQMSQRVNKNIKQLTEAASAAPTVNTIDPDNFSPLIATYFNCSNLADPDKYEIKKWIVRCIERFMGNYLKPGLKKRIQNEVKREPNKDKTTVLVFHEHYNHNHAMYRGHHSRISALKDKFHTVGVGLHSQFDAVAQKDFHETIIITEEHKSDITHIVKKILKIQPDIILYPSVGMSLLVTFIASIRLAPIQIASAGHPSSTYFKSIDYFHSVDCGQGTEIMEKILFEKWLGYKKGGTYRADTPFTLKEMGLDKQKTNIVVNGVIQKVSHEVLNVCLDINKKSKELPVFHFFMTHPKQNMEFYSTQSLLRRFLPNSVIHSFTDYSNYMSILNECDFAIATFPFGGTNSNVDLMKLNKPKLYILDDSDLSGLTDYNAWHAVDYMSGLCDSVEQMIVRAIEWVNNPLKLDDERKAMVDANLCEKLNGENTINEKEIGLAIKFEELINDFNTGL